MFVEILKSILYGIIEAITEWLPISSTGHMILLNSFIPIEFSVDGMWDFFLVAIQLGAIIAVIVYFFRKLWPFGKGKTKEEKKSTWSLWLKVLIACVPAAIIGIFFDDALDRYLYNSLTVSITLIVYGILFIVIEILNKKRQFTVQSVGAISFKTAAIIGCIQLLALIPGTSRSGVTIIGAMLIGLNRETSAEFSFFLSIPVMFGASLLKGTKYVLNYGLPNLNDTIILIVAMLTAFVVSMFVIKFLMNFVKKHTFKVFGWYRIGLGILILALAFFRVINLF